MQVASVIGRDFAFRILQTITGMKEELKESELEILKKVVVNIDKVFEAPAWRPKK